MFIQHTQNLFLLSLITYTILVSLLETPENHSCFNLKFHNFYQIFRLFPYFHISFEPGGRQIMSPFLGIVGK